MSNVSDFTGENRTVAQLQSDVSSMLGGPGGPTDGGLEPRIAKLEGIVEGLAKDVSQITPNVADARERLIALEVKVDHLPGKGFIVSVTTTALALIAGLFFFAEKLLSVVQ